jgi:organic radical activating enzyme
MIHSAKLVSALENIYISPLELCNLNCRHCYTQKTKNILTNRQILNFVRRYSQYLNNHYSKNLDNDFLGALNVVTHSQRQKKHYQGLLKLKSILFCGGEVFTLKNFPRLVNNLIAKGIFISIITNGTIDELSKIKDPRNCQLIVSFDGPPKIHDANRGQGNFAKSQKFVAHALKLGFPVEIFFLITKDSYPYKDSFDIFGLPKTYLTDRLFSLTLPQTLDIKKNYPSYPNPQFGCFQLALQSNGQVYGCCESPYPLANFSDPIKKIVANFVNSLNPCQNCHLSDKQFFSAQRMRGLPSPKVASTAKICLSDQRVCFGCCAPDYLCGYKKEFKETSCQSVVKLIQS